MRIPCPIHPVSSGANTCQVLVHTGYCKWILKDGGFEEGEYFRIYIGPLSHSTQPFMGLLGMCHQEPSSRLVRSSQLRIQIFRHLA